MSQNPDVPGVEDEERESGRPQRVVMRPTSSRQRVVITLENADSEISAQDHTQTEVPQEITRTHGPTESQRYTYIPSTSSFSRGSPSPPPVTVIQQPPASSRHGYRSQPPIIIQQPPASSRHGYHSQPPIIIQPSSPTPGYQPQPIIIQQPSYAGYGYHNQPERPPIIIQPPSHTGHDYPQSIIVPSYSPSPQTVFVQPGYGEGSYYDGSLASDDATSTFIAVDPFRPSSHTKPSLPTTQPGGYPQYPPGAAPQYVVFPYSRRRRVFVALLKDFLTMLLTFFFDTLPRQLYLHFLLRLPSFYFSRVAHIFEEAGMALPEIRDMALQGMDPFTMPHSQWSSPASANLRSTWEGFIDSLLREWKTLNIVSVLLLSAILTILQIEAAGADPITRSCALFSLLCSLMSLLYGCMYIIRFAGMRKAYKALEWAEEAQKTKTLIWWNVWVLLAMPATWLAWSIILYIACIMSFVWRTSSATAQPVILSSRAELAIRVALSAVLGLGVLYFLFILNTLRRYGDTMDKKFKWELSMYVKESKSRHHAPSYTGSESSTRSRPFQEPYGADLDYEVPSYESPRSRSEPPSVTIPPQRPHPPQSVPPSLVEPPQQQPPSQSMSSDPAAMPPPQPPVVIHIPPPPPPLSFDTGPLSQAVKVLDLRFHDRKVYDMPYSLTSRGFTEDDWERFLADALIAWDGDAPMYQTRLLSTISEPLRPQDNVAEILRRWNIGYFNPRGTTALLCHEYIDMFPYSPAFAVYLVDTTTRPGQILVLAERFGPVPEGLTRVDIFDEPGDGRSRRRILGRTSIFSSSNPVDSRVHFPGHTYDQPHRRRSYSHPRPRSRHSSYDRRPHSRDSRTESSYRTQSSYRRRSTSRSRSPQERGKQGYPKTPHYPKTTYYPADLSPIASESYHSTAYRDPSRTSQFDRDNRRRRSWYSEAESQRRSSGSTSAHGMAVPDPRRPSRADTTLSSASFYPPLLVFPPENPSHQNPSTNRERPIMHHPELTESPKPSKADLSGSEGLSQQQQSTGGSAAVVSRSRVPPTVSEPGPSTTVGRSDRRGVSFVAVQKAQTTDGSIPTSGDRQRGDRRFSPDDQSRSSRSRSPTQPVAVTVPDPREGGAGTTTATVTVSDSMPNLPDFPGSSGIERREQGVQVQDSLTQNSERTLRPAIIKWQSQVPTSQPLVAQGSNAGPIGTAHWSQSVPRGGQGDGTEYTTQTEPARGVHWSQSAAKEERGGGTEYTI